MTAAIISYCRGFNSHASCDRAMRCRKYDLVVFAGGKPKGAGWVREFEPQNPGSGCTEFEAVSGWGDGPDSQEGH